MDEVFHRLGKKWTRQALSSHSKIRFAFQHQKTALRHAKLAPRKVKSDGKYGGDDLARLLRDANETIDELRQEIAILKARFVRWQNNAAEYRISVDQLDKPLQQIDRGRTDR